MKVLRPFSDIFQGSNLQEEHKETAYHSRDTWIFNALSNQEGAICHLFSYTEILQAKEPFYSGNWVVMKWEKVREPWHLRQDSQEPTMYRLECESLLK